MSVKGPIILIEDDSDDQFLLKSIVEELQIPNPIIFFSNGLEALLFLETTTEQPFIIFCDINMPVMNGWEFLNAIAERPYVNRVHVVMVSSATEESEKEKALNYSQVIDYQQKPLNIESCGRIVHSEMLKGFFEDFTAE